MDKEELIPIIIVLFVGVILIFAGINVNQMLEDKFVAHAISECNFDKRCIPLVIEIMEEVGYDDSGDFREDMYNIHKQIMGDQKQ